MKYSTAITRAAAARENSRRSNLGVSLAVVLLVVVVISIIGVSG